MKQNITKSQVKLYDACSPIQPSVGTQYTGEWKFVVSDFNKLPYLLRSQGDNEKNEIDLYDRAIFSVY